MSSPDRTTRGVRTIKAAMLVTDVGFLLYWTAALLNLIPPQQAYKDYGDPVMSDWNFSFLPLDIAASITGLASLCLAGNRRHQKKTHAHLLPLQLMLISLTLTSVAGLQAVAFWALRGDWSLIWWIPNLILLVFPIPSIVHLMRGPTAGDAPADDPAAALGRR
ncbi:DUF5360 family protein [Streptomyces capoamus]|uniref:DUF5360 family protein n=1 Tax=Streptomyces capoamus TaxID=68183 RepID=UPI003C2AB9AA